MTVCEPIVKPNRSKQTSSGQVRKLGSGPENPAGDDVGGRRHLQVAENGGGVPEDVPVAVVEGDHHGLRRKCPPVLECLERPEGRDRVIAVGRSRVICAAKSAGLTVRVCVTAGCDGRIGPTRWYISTGRSIVRPGSGDGSRSAPEAGAASRAPSAKRRAPVRATIAVV